MVVTREGLACGGNKRTKELFEQAKETLVREHGTNPSVLHGFVDQVLQDMLPGFGNARCREHLAKKLRDYLSKYHGTRLPEAEGNQTNWARCGVIVALLAIVISVLFGLYT